MVDGIPLVQSWGPVKQELFVRAGFMQPTHIARTQAEDAARTAEVERLRERIHEVQRNADARNADLHKQVAYYEAISERTHILLNRFKVERGERRVIEWFADVLHTQPLDYRMPPSPGSTYAFWLAFQQVLEGDRLAATTTDGAT